MDPLQMSPDAPLGQPPPGQVTDFRNPVDQQRYNQFVITLALIYPLSTICVLLRLWTRGIVVKQWGWDDTFALISLFLNVGMTVEYVGVIRTGLADYDWNVRAADWLTNDHDSFTYWNSVGSILFYLLYAFIKTSILLLYLRVIGKTHLHHHKVVYGLVYALIFLVWASVLGCSVAILCFCQPTAKLFHPEIPGTCSVHTDVFFAQAVISVATDVLILIPPIPFIWNLRCSRSKKIGLLVVLGLGLVVTSIAIVRAVAWDDPIVYLLFDNFNGVYWTMVEVNFALIAVCLPALNQLLLRYRRGSSYHSRRSPAMTASRGTAGSPHTPGPYEGSCGRTTPMNKRKRSPISQMIHDFYSQIEHSYEEEEESVPPVPVEKVHHDIEKKASFGTFFFDDSSDEVNRSPQVVSPPEAAHVVGE